MIGESLGPYTILEPLGAGGMGEVYLGEDTRLGRKVAIKVLPEEFASDPERLARFEQEAKAAAALNHPHIAAVYDIGFEPATGGDGDDAGQTGSVGAAGIHFIVQEYLEGEPLRGPLSMGALPIKKALALGAEIAEALRAAHAVGIIHRDLKPDNVFVSNDGHAKVLDFGLAKLTEGAATSGDSASMSPTLLGTVAGQVMGTAGYMAPEQAEGAGKIDHRVDLFAFGSVLYEMATGKRAFAGRSVAETLSLIQHEQPSSLVEVDRSLPAELDRIVNKALAKDPADRYQHADDLIVDLRALTRGVDTGTVAPAVAAAGERAPASPLGGIPWGLAVPMLVVVAIAAGLAGRWLPRAETAAPIAEMRFPLNFPEEVIGLPRGTGANITISPDGQTLVYAGEDETGTKRLYLRRMGETGSVPIPNTEGATVPKLSPDGEWVLFAGSRGTTDRILLSGGEPFAVCSNCQDGLWADDGNIYFVSVGSLYRIPATGNGDRELISAPRPEEGVTGFLRPTVLPGSRAIVFEIGNYDFGGVAVLSLEDGRVIHISPDGSEPIYSTTGHILFPRRGTLFAVPFDATNLEVTGAAEPVLQGVRVENAGAMQADLAHNGTFVYQPADGPQRTQLVWVDRRGRGEPASEERKNYSHPRISPEGSRAAVVVNENGDTDVWIVDLGTGNQRQLTTAGDAAAPTWSSDGSSVAYSAGSDGAYAIYLADAESGRAEELVSGEHPMMPMDFTPEDDQLVFVEISSAQDIFVLDLEQRTTKPLFTTERAEAAAALSPDGTMLAYDSDRTGVREVYVRPFPEGNEIQISTNNGFQPIWSSDGSELFYQEGVGRIFAATIQTEPRFQVVRQGPLFSGTPFWLGIIGAAFDSASDGRLLMVRHRDPTDPPDRLEVILNFSETLESLAPGGR